jgi:hypothetical protein
MYYGTWQFRGLAPCNSPESNNLAVSGFEPEERTEDQVIDFGIKALDSEAGKQGVVTVGGEGRLLQRYFADPNRAL